MNRAGATPSPSLAVFHADGACIEDYPDAGWHWMDVRELTGEGAALLNVHRVYVIDDRLVNAEWRWTVEVYEAGDALRAAGNFVGRFEDGSIGIAVEPVQHPPRSPFAPFVGIRNQGASQRCGNGVSQDVSPGARRTVRRLRASTPVARSSSRAATY